MDKKIVEIDGSVLEGGGQILRISLVISVLSGTPIHVYNIRAGRSKPGLREQHLKGVELARDICRGNVEGATLGSTDIRFFPGGVTAGSYVARVATAGSISLLMQVAIPCLLFAGAESKLDLYGGTNAEMAPQVDYTTEVFRPIMRKFGADFHFTMVKRGYFPAGGGRVTVDVIPSAKLRPVQLLELGEVRALYGWSFVAGRLPVNVANAMADGAADALKPHHRWIQVDRYKESAEMAPNNCSGILLVAETSTGAVLGGSSLGKRDETPTETGERAAEELIRPLTGGACVDEHSQDQVVLFMALADGLSRIRAGEITLHTKTAIHIAEKLTAAKFKIVPDGGGCSIIECRGIGLRNSHDL